LAQGRGWAAAMGMPGRGGAPPASGGPPAWRAGDWRSPPASPAPPGVDQTGSDCGAPASSPPPAWSLPPPQESANVAPPPEAAGDDDAPGAAWRASGESGDWLYKPSVGIYFHSPTETLWKRSCISSKPLVRVDVDAGIAGGDVAERASASLRTPGARAHALLTSCFATWRAELRKFEAARSAAGQNFARPRTSRGGTAVAAATGAVVEATAPVGTRSCPPMPLTAPREPIEADTGLARFLPVAFSWRLPGVNARASAGGGGGPAPSPRPRDRADAARAAASLTPSSLARHNTAGSLRRSCASACPPPPPVLAGSCKDLHQHKQLAVVHREREGGWRCHVGCDRDDPSPLECTERLLAAEAETFDAEDLLGGGGGGGRGGSGVGGGAARPLAGGEALATWEASGLASRTRAHI